MTYATWESDGRFGLSRQSTACGFDDCGDLGRGDIAITMAFGSAEARGYYVQAEEARDEAKQAKRELEHLKADFLRCLTPTGKLKTSRVGKLQFQRFVARVQGAIRMGNGSSIAVGFVDEADKIRGTER